MNITIPVHQMEFLEHAGHVAFQLFVFVQVTFAEFVDCL